MTEERRPWPPALRAVVVAAIVIAMGSLFVTSYTLALGDPVPHRIDAAVVGNPHAHPAALAALERVADQGLVLHPYPSLAAARHALAEQRVYAIFDARAPRLYLASAAGASVAHLLEQGAAAAKLPVTDERPLPRSDPQGLDVFYLVLAATILGFVTVFQIRANASGLGLRAYALFLVCFALAASLVLSLVAGAILHKLALPFWEGWGLLALQVLTAASFNATMVVLIGRWAIVPTWLLFVVLGNASSGGAVSPPLLPRPFAFFSQWLPSGATVTSVRNAVYFQGAQHLRPVLVLLGWAVFWFAAMLVASHRRGRSPGIA